jgi:predicted metal-dependent TIM-barrel fold hydrolase
MTTERQRLFSRRGRQYMLAYHAIDNDNPETMTNDNTTATNTGEKKQKPAISMTMIENIVKTYKTHRNIGDSDTGYINSVVVTTMKLALSMNNVSNYSDDRDVHR